MMQKGFTLVELVTVMVIIGILAAYAAPRFNQSAFELAAAREELVEALRYAQHQSMSNTGAVGFEVVVTAAGFTVQRQDGTAVADPAGGQYQRTWTDIGFSPATVAFDGWGATNGVTVITLSASGNNMTVSVEDVTGYVH